MIKYFVGKVLKQGNSKMVTIPANIVDLMELKVDDLLDVSIKKRKGEANEGKRDQKD